MSYSAWVCVNDKSHVFDTQTAEQNNYFCPTCPYGEGILLGQKSSPSPPPTPDAEGNSNPGNGYYHTGKPTEEQFTRPKFMEDLGLCIMLLDCSGSMADPAFPSSPLSKRDLVAKSVSAGIFSLSGNPLKEFAYVLIIGFDHSIDILLPYTSIEEIVDQYKDASTLEKMLKDKMYAKNGATDINEALRVAFKFTQQFINGEIEALGVYKPRIQAVLDDNMISSQIPNVRVVLFTDGGQYLGPGKTALNPSPFQELRYNGRIFNLLMAAYYGSGKDDDFIKLKTLTSRCPRHPDSDQLFLFDDPSKVANLKGLFRMASGASGFCPVCLDEANAVTRDY